MSITALSKELLLLVVILALKCSIVDAPLSQPEISSYPTEYSGSDYEAPAIDIPIDPFLLQLSMSFPICRGERRYRIACQRCRCDDNTNEISGCRDTYENDLPGTEHSLPNDDTCTRTDHGNCFCGSFDDQCEYAKRWQMEEEKWEHYEHIKKTDEMWMYYKFLKELDEKCAEIKTGSESGSKEAIKQNNKMPGVARPADWLKYSSGRKRAP